MEIRVIFGVRYEDEKTFQKVKFSSQVSAKANNQRREVCLIKPNIFKGVGCEKDKTIVVCNGFCFWNNNDYECSDHF